MRPAALLLILMLTGCAAQAAGGSASISLDALVREHPLYETLAQYDRQIAALGATLHTVAFSRKDTAFANAQAGVRAQLTDAAARAGRIAALPVPGVHTLNALPAAAAPTESDVRGGMQRTYVAQAAQFRRNARTDMALYRRALLAQQHAAFARYVRNVQARVRQAYLSREQELYERESTLALNLAKSDAPERLPIRMKLQTLMLRTSKRRALEARMNVIQAREEAVVARQHKRDERLLTAFLPRLQARADVDIARMRAQLQSRTAANLAERERVLAAQVGADMPLNFGGSASPGPVQTSGTAPLQALLRSQPADPKAFLQARAVLTRQISGVRAADSGATRSALAQITSLRRERAQLYRDIVRQIMRDAQAIARSRGLSRVYIAGQAPAGSVDITAQVRSDLIAFTR